MNIPELFTAGNEAVYTKDGGRVIIHTIKGRWLNVSRADGVKFNVARADLAVVPPDEAPKSRYSGPMLLLRERSKRGLYHRSKNGQPSCGDDIAQILGQLEPEFVIRACLISLDYTNNPYAHLNVGQQSMNLRNKIRGAMLREEFGLGVVKEAAEDMLEAQNAAQQKGTA